MDDLDTFLIEHLKLWKDLGVPAPANELQSIAAWLAYLGEHGAEKTIETMQVRMMLLTDAVEKLHKANAEEVHGIYDERPDLRPTDPTEEPGFDGYGW